MVNGADPWAISGATIVLVLIAAGAAGIPARLASHIAPMQVLRYE